MMWIFGIVLISGMKALLCKGFSLGGFLLLFWIKGRQLRFNSDEWIFETREQLLRLFHFTSGKKAAKVCYLYLSGGCYVLFVYQLFHS